MSQILIIEDNPDLTYNLNQAFRQAGYDTAFADRHIFAYAHLIKQSQHVYTALIVDYINHTKAVSGETNPYAQLLFATPDAPVILANAPSLNLSHIPGQNMVRNLHLAPRMDNIPALFAKLAELNIHP